MEHQGELIELNKKNKAKLRALVHGHMAFRDKNTLDELHDEP